MRLADLVQFAMMFMKCTATSYWKDDVIPIALLSMRLVEKNILFSISVTDGLQHINR